MPKDIREILKNRQQKQVTLPKGHKKRFEDKLRQLHKPKKYYLLKIAAAIMLLASVGYFSSKIASVSPSKEIETPAITGLSSISPEMQKVESYYLTAINYEIAGIEVTPQNKALLDNYLDKIEKLDKDYKRLNKELSTNGINEKTVNALVTNLQLRLQLLFQLKDRLN
ncbi:MAG TPA: hypothetical protein ENK46_09280, partial [Flavobacteriia bacterium]|nr:hypothetical protein [Flavobacteriia bacterium]